jgi:hypothetical protein
MNHSRVLAYDDMTIKELHGVQLRKSGGKINEQLIVNGHSPHHRASRGIGAVHSVEAFHLQSSLSYILPDSRPKGTQ